MEETPNTMLDGPSPEARRNVIDTTALLTPRDKENAGANSTRHSQSAAIDQPKVSSTVSTTTVAPPSARTPARAKLTSQAPLQVTSPSFFFSATTPSPASTTAKSLPAAKDSSASSISVMQHSNHTTAQASSALLSLTTQRSPPGTSQVLRKHFQSLGFTSPPAKQALSHQRQMTSGAVRLTPNSRKKAHKGNQTLGSRRVGFDGTKYTPSKELLKSTASSRNQRVPALQDMSMEQPVYLEANADDLEEQVNPIQLAGDTMDDESSTAASAATMDDASFDMSLPCMNHPTLMGNSCSVIPAPHSPLMPRMGCLNPVALTLLNDGKEDYNYLLTQDALYPIPKVEDTTDMGGQPANASISSSSSTSSSCLSPTQSFGQSPAEVRATLSHTVRSTLARPIALIPKTGRNSPPHTRLLMRPQPKHVR